MARNPNIAVIKIGYNSYAFEDAQSALELMALMSKAVPVEEEAWSVRETTPCTHFLAESSELPELKFVSVQKFNPNETLKEFKERYAREQKDREDLNQSMRVLAEPASLPAPSDDNEFL